MICRVRLVNHLMPRGLTVFLALVGVACASTATSLPAPTPTPASKLVQVETPAPTAVAPSPTRTPTAEPLPTETATPTSVPRLEPKVDSKISQLVRQILDDLRTRGVTRENARTQDVSSLSVEGALKINEHGEIQLRIFVTQAGREQLRELKDHEVRVELVNIDLNVIQAWVPFDKVESLAELEYVKSIRPPDYAFTRVAP